MQCDMKPVSQKITLVMGYPIFYLVGESITFCYLSTIFLS